MKAGEIRQAFIEFYRQKDHRIVKSAPLVPLDDPSLLFTSAGMVQFKKYFAGTAELPYRRAVSVQKCLRVTDIDEVGRTPRHDTFFEMLGHFSFGDYFKKEAITWNWDLFTRVYKLDPEKLTASVYQDDDEAYEIWRQVVGLAEAKIIRLGKEHNFWGPAGGTGACGPCSELHYDLGPQSDPEHPGARPGDDCNRYVEVGNFVFPQFDRQADGSDLPLKNRGIDTGIGLERLAMAVQGKTSIFHTDLFWPLVQRAAQVCKRPYEGNEVPLHIIADHVRALTFALGEGILPSNEGRGYVIRRLIRRSAVQGYTLGLEEPFLFSLVDLVVEIMRAAYPEIEEGRERAVLALRNEEERFRSTLEHGIEKLQAVLEQAGRAPGRQVPGAEAFLLYDTYGLPLDLIRDMALGQGVEVDEEGFDRCMKEQKQRSRAAATFHQEMETISWTHVNGGAHSEFLGYETLRATGCRVRRYAELQGDRPRLVVVLDRTPFYGQSGGQVGDTGILRSGQTVLRVDDVLRKADEIHHVISVDVGHELQQTADEEGHDRAGEISRMRTLLADDGTEWEAIVDEARRSAVARHHTATHLLQAALRTVLGKHVAQAGSLVAPDRLRFDFTHFATLSLEEKEEVERIANRIIQENLPVEVAFTTYDDAIRDGVTALFGEKYDAEQVRRVRIGDFSEELCGGTHLNATGEIGALIILDESAVAAGTRRIEAVCGQSALGEVQRMREQAAQLRRLLGSAAEDVVPTVEGLVQEVGALRKELARARRGDGVSRLDSLFSDAETVGANRLLVGEVQAASVDELRHLGDRVRERLGQGAAVLCAGIGKKTTFLALVTHELSESGLLRADEIVRKVASAAGGSGGGKPHMALGGAGDQSKVPEALEEARRLLRAALEKA